ncbi:hypothetical protein JVU11DRAFT_10262 [Chiua virens]|nr:hypothetical protein JVU11DRAFT_10262 [Chiua virens]
MSINFIAVGIAFNVIKGLAVLLALFRLGLRWKMRQFWWEDMWAAVAMFCTVTSMLCALITSDSKQYGLRIIVGRIEIYMFTCIVWSVRMSLIFSIIRITLWTHLRRIMLAVSACFFVVWVVALSLQIRCCLANPKASALSASTRASCVIPLSVVVFEITTSFVADMTTLAFSFKLLWRVKLPSAQHRMILWLFSVSRFLCTLSVAHSICQLVGGQSGIQEIMGDMEVAGFMVFCNLAVVVTYIYRVFWHSRSPEKAITSPSRRSSGEDDEASNTPSPPRATQILTTVDLDLTINADTTESLMNTTAGSSP